MSTPKESDYLKVSEIAKMLGVTKRWVYRRIWNGELPASKVGKLYFVRREDVDILLDKQRDASQDESEQPSLEKCGNCLRLTSTANIVDVCAHGECEKPLCSDCWGQGKRTCQPHEPTRAQKWAEAQKKQAQHDLLLLAGDARLKEINFINRIQKGLSEVDTLIHPQTEEIVIVENWDTIKVQRDQRREVMQLLGRFTLSKETTSHIPLNLSLRYPIRPVPGQTGGSITIYVETFSHLPAMVNDGFDTQLFGKDELREQLLKFSETADNAQESFLVVLAATTGWDEDARRQITGTDTERPFIHRFARFYLYDMETNELTYNQQDRLSRGYAELFSPLLKEEQLEDVMGAIEERLHSWAYDHITLAEVKKLLPQYATRLLEEAFQRLATRDDYILDEGIADSTTLIHT